MRRAARWLRPAVLGLALLVLAAGLALLRPPWETLHSGPSAVSADPERLAAHVRKLAGELAPRDWRSVENLQRVADYVHGQLALAGGRVRRQSFQAAGGDYHNVIATFGPDTRERLVVGAHYDTDGPLPGADDNASGVAGLLELARLLQAQPPGLRVELAAYTLEELPWFGSDHMGSAVHARALRARDVPVRMMLSLEMIGYFSDAPGSQRYPVALLRLLYPSRGNFIAVVGRLLHEPWMGRLKAAMRGAGPLPVHSINAPPGLPGMGLSDHASFWAAGYDAAMVTDTAFYRNPNYHRASDRPHTLDYRRMAQVVDAVHAGLHALAE